MFENDLKEKGNHKRESVLGSIENCLEDFYRNGWYWLLVHKTEVICSSQWQNHIFANERLSSSQLRPENLVNLKHDLQRQYAQNIWDTYLLFLSGHCRQVSRLPSLKGKITLSSQSTSSESQILTGHSGWARPFLAAFQIWTPLTQQQFYGKGIDAVPDVTDASLKNILKVVYREMPSFSWLSFPWVKSAQWLVRLSRPSNHCFCWRGSAPEWFKWLLKPWLTCRLLF